MRVENYIHIGNMLIRNFICFLISVWGEYIRVDFSSEDFPINIFRKVITLTKIEDALLLFILRFYSYTNNYFSNNSSFLFMNAKCPL